MVAKFKVIKPPKLNRMAMDRATAGLLKEAGDIIKKDFEDTVSTWDHKVVFSRTTTHVDQTVSEIGVTIDTADKYFLWADEGTKPHMIFAGIYTGKSKAKTLKIGTNSKPATRPGILRPQNKQYATVFVRRPFVNHPGTTPRNFSKMIRDFRDKWFQQWMQKKMDVVWAQTLDEFEVK